MISQNTANQFVKTNLDIDTNDFVIDETRGWAIQSWTTPFPQGKLPTRSYTNNPDKERLWGMVGTQDSINFDPLSQTVVLTKNVKQTLVIDGKRKSVTKPTVRTIFQKGAKYVMHIYNGITAELLTLNWAAIAASNSLIGQVKAEYAAFYGSSDGDSEAANLINFMATSELVLKYKPFTLSGDEIEVGYVITNSDQGLMEVSVLTDVNGTYKTPERIFTQMYPTKPMQGLPNTAQNRGSGAAFSQRQSFELSSDLNVRGVEHVMAGGIFNFKTVVTVQDTNGNNVYKEHNQPIDLTRELHAYNYFNL
jgi:hypothetical protein